MKTQRNLTCILLSEEPVQQATYCMILQKRQNYGDRKKIGDRQGLGEGRDKWVKHRGFLGQ